MLELHALKGARAVLSGGGGGNATSLPEPSQSDIIPWEVLMCIRLPGAILIVVAGAAILCVGIPNGAPSQEKKEREGVIEVWVENPVGMVATITLYGEGKAIATKDVRFGGRTTFDRLPLRAYEVRCEAPEHATVVKRVLLREGDRSQVLMTRLPKGKGSVALGAGPSLQDLEARIKKLEEAVAKLQKK
jgi:hypothetical protein